MLVMRVSSAPARILRTLRRHLEESERGARAPRSKAVKHFRTSDVTSAEDSLLEALLSRRF